MSTAYIDCHYARTATACAPRPALDGAVEADVCVVGGGLAGLSTARQLFVFTCHPGVAAELEGRGGRVLRLEQAG